MTTVYPAQVCSQEDAQVNRAQFLSPADTQLPRGGGQLPENRGHRLLYSQRLGDRGTCQTSSCCQIQELSFLTQGSRPH